MGSNLPSRKHSKFNTRFSPYARASPRALRSSEAHEIQELEWGTKASLKSYQLELQRQEDDVGSVTPTRAPALPTPAPALLDSPRGGAPPAPRKTVVWTAVTPPGAMTRPWPRWPCTCSMEAPCISTSAVLPRSPEESLTFRQGQTTLSFSRLTRVVAEKTYPSSHTSTHSRRNSIWIGSDMDIDLPMSSASGTYGCVDTAMEDEEHKILLAVIPVGDFVGGESEGHQFPKRRRLVHGLHKTVEKYMQRHLDTKDPRTDQVRERVHIALQAALVCVDVNDVVLPMQSPDSGNKAAQQTDNYLIPYVIANRIVNGVTSGLQLLGIALSTTSKDLKPTSRAVSTIWQFVLLRGAGDFLRAPFLARHSHFENCNPTVPATLSRRQLLSFIVWVLFRNSCIV
ncbi:uncharacterized protein F5147DRAFT_650013 [Suillus discolor]|uniref:Uncharacterized protein n=1 Tax=Suillus discolor TaxID=1912936 RepID=A0A9P7FEQ9_9AGAM|nr:uncharacterized protein F5147DRAFT_650013 [Suillus discolor]KAG2114204.1 hypothetical protein F5147DRAFT_650013 [Suillus discolor]